MEKEKSVAKKEQKAGVKAPAQPEQDDAAQISQAGQPGGEPYYRSQREVDAAFARRMDAERRKWAMQAQMQAAGVGQPQVEAMPALPMMQQEAAGQPGLPMGAALPQQAPAMGGMDQAVQAGALAQPGMPADAGFNNIVMRLLAEEADIQQVFPEFDLESFIAADASIQNALLSGKSLWSVFAGVYGNTIRKQAEDAAVERIRSRNSAMPDVLRSGGAAGNVGLDYANMSSEQFNKIRKAYEAEMRMGKKIRP